MTELENLAVNIRTLRKELGQSQIEFGFNCGISMETVSLLECMKVNPTLETIQKIAAYTGKTVIELLSKNPE